MNIKSNIWFENDKHGFFGKGRIELLEKINEYGSISAAAKAMKMSYKAAWDAINEMNNLSETPIVKRESGGKGGGGTVLTEQGHITIALYKKLEKMQKHFWNSIESIGDDIDLLENFSKRMTFQTSARNQLLAAVTNIDTTKLGATLTLVLSGGENIKVYITRRSLDEMQITNTTKLFVLLKSSWIEVSNNSKEGCNNIPCKLTNITTDSHNAEIDLLTSGGNALTASLSLKSFKDLSLREGDTAWMYFKPSNAIVAL
ncbi:TOBE domain-containing protein [Sulfurimonas autotrophica]|uniref:Transcriptional regulator, ModE family n=1 Tax=Sulfurimonas autotrophica (strain ATCC BAA-671 / DSM 16294 / JCM 11897 / OK10) TaxID=563040 RepID=E0UR35_SULAO|nr:TOBE domain-containing protein [Sulfurimonas autotrophica]ADN09991.1 transcriptional regulator, ModE family [Sulfurimonas autotrophica DSM 16294]